MSSAELKKVGLKVTLPRLKILEILEQKGDDHHLTAEDVYKRMRKLTRTEREQMAEDSKCRYIIKILFKESKVLCDEFEKIHRESCQ
jgi:hypothetical protein